MVGFVCFGEINTPIEKLQEKHDEAYRRLSELVPNVVDAGLAIDDAGTRLWMPLMKSWPARI